MVSINKINKKNNQNYQIIIISIENKMKLMVDENDFGRTIRGTVEKI